MFKKVVVLYGPPGSGKSTQASLISDKLHLIHFDTGRFLELVVHDPKRQKSAIIKRERKLFESGTLLTPSFVFKEVRAEVEKYANAGRGLVLSGSPRTLYEAKALVPILEKLYGKRKVYVIDLKIPANTSVKRNVKRLVCTICAAPILTEFYPSVKPKYCPRCGGPLYRRAVDKPEAIKKRLQQYFERTEPVLRYFKEHKYNVHEINAYHAPYKVLHEVLKAVSD